MSGAAKPAVVEMCGLSTRIGDRFVHRNLDLRVERGQVVGLVGGSGSGKTTLLRQILGLIQPAAGSVRLFGEDLGAAGAVAQSALLRRLGMLFQAGALFSALPAFDNIAFPLRELKCLDEDWIRRLVNLKLAMVELEVEHGKLMPAELSGGMVKRVALARALALEPELLLLDEPTAGLDPDRSRSFVKLLGQLQVELGLTVIMVTHDPETLAGLATHIAVLADQHIIKFGTFASFFDLCDRVDRRIVTKRVLDALIKSGALDTLCDHRAQLSAILDDETPAKPTRSHRNVTQQTLLHFLPGESETRVLPQIPTWAPSIQLDHEREALGCYVSHHPVRVHDHQLKRLQVVPLTQLPDLPDGK